MPHTRLHLVGAALTMLLACGCSRGYFAPAPASHRLFAGDDSARAAISGVVITARADVWRGDPPDLPSRITPIRLDLTNLSTHPISLRYRDFRITSRYGLRSQALPPFRIHVATGPAAARSIVPDFSYSGFAVYPRYDVYKAAIHPWRDDWGWNRNSYRGLYAGWGDHLPTADMLRRAIPEGVLEPNGHIRGFLYFQHVPASARAPELDQSLVDAVTHHQFAAIEIPFLLPAA
ncbi:MAG: hypothetical protein IT160_20095 [Bryobacterales bacterium]|nr:hypothetical protein [Bryobacterales bacterium]